MIATNLQPQLIESIALFFESSLAHEALPIALLERQLKWGIAFRNLERGDASFFEGASTEELLQKAYGFSKPLDFRGSDSVAYWIGESYASLFFRRNLSFSVIAAVLPIAEMKRLYYPYHEMGFSSLLEEFERRLSKTSLLETAKKKAGLTYVQIAKCAGIPIPTLARYVKNEELWRISLARAKALSVALDQPMEYFLPSCL